MVAEEGRIKRSEAPPAPPPRPPAPPSWFPDVIVGRELTSFECVEFECSNDARASPRTLDKGGRHSPHSPHHTRAHALDARGPFERRRRRNTHTHASSGGAPLGWKEEEGRKKQTNRLSLDVNRPHTLAQRVATDAPDAPTTPVPQRFDPRSYVPTRSSSPSSAPRSRTTRSSS